MLKSLNQISIKKKLFFITIIGAVLPLFVLLCMFSFNMYEQFETSQSEKIDFLNSRLQLNFETAINHIQDTTMDYREDVLLTTALENSTVDTIKMIDHDIIKDLTLNTEVDKIEIFMDKSLEFEGEAVKELHNIRKVSWYNTFLKSPQYLVLSGNIDDGDVYLGMAKSLDVVQGYSKNLVRVSIDERRLSELLQDPLLEELNAQAYLVYKNDLIVASDKLLYKRGDHQFKSFDKETLEETYLVTEKEVGSDTLLKGWTIQLTIDKKLLLREFLRQMIVLAMASMLIILILFYMSRIVSKNISSRLAIINQQMSEVDQEFKTIEDFMGSDEIGTTAIHFNDMVIRIRTLMSEIKDDKEKINQLLDEKTDAYENTKKSMVKIKKQSDRINDLVYLDMLTGLKNRFAITEHIARHIANSDEDKMAVIFIDVDNFKFINDTYGHDLGDKVINATGQLLVQNSDRIEIGRFGGDEFIVVCDEFETIEEIEMLAETIRQQFTEPVMVEDKKFYLTISLGIAVYPENGSTHQEIMKKADLALYASKASGRNTYSLFTNDMDYALEEDMKFQNAIIEAFARNEFYLNYQPYFNASKEELTGYEALIRWKSDVYGQVSPYKLITHVEAIGLIIEVGEWVFKEACYFAKRINDQSEKALKVSINISIIQLTSHNFYNRILEIIHDIGVDPSWIVLEMTETILIESMEVSIPVVEAFRSAGFEVALDDFGIGYSSLNYLKSLPVNILKIDRSFVNNMTKSDFDFEVIKMIINVAHKRSLTVVAEGVETMEQLQMLKENQCDTIQGYYLSRPLSESDAYKLV